MGLTYRFLSLLMMAAGAALFYSGFVGTDEKQAANDFKRAFLLAQRPSFQWTAQPEPPEPRLTPDMGAIEKQAITAAREFRKEYARSRRFLQDPGTYRLQEIEITGVVKVPEMLPDTVSPGPAIHDAYLVRVLLKMRSWKNDVDALVVLKDAGGKYAPVLFYGGGQNGRGIGWELVDTDYSQDGSEILIFDGQSGNQMSQTRARLFTYDPVKDRFREVFSELIDYSAAGPCTYDSEIEWDRKDKNPADLIVKSTITFYGQGFEETGRARRESVFRWDGERYQGTLNIPECDRDSLGGGRGSVAGSS